jgi:hypothetical protein
MRARLVSIDVVGLAETPARYRVRVWGPPPAAGSARALDEWDVFDATDVRDVLRWVTDNAGDNEVEVFAVIGGARPLYVRILGVDGDADSGTAEHVLFVGE